MLIKKISKAGKSLMAGFLAAGLISAAAWLVAPAVLPNQQMIVYAAEVPTKTYWQIPKTGKCGALQRAVCATGGVFPTPNRRLASCVGGRR